MTTPTSVEEYMAGIPQGSRTVLEKLRKAIKAAAPEAAETISYLMPAFKLDGRFLVSYAAFKRHYSLFPASDAVIEALGDELTPYLVGSGTIRFPANKPIPASLVTRIVAIRFAENAAHAER
jgi:uncharacterized protein YdhG (YjbR/CyaY superfamily)